MSDTFILKVGVSLIGIFFVLFIMGTPCYAHLIEVKTRKIAKRLNATVALVTTPTLLKEVKGLTEFKLLEETLHTSIFYDHPYFYLVPDSYLGYYWCPEFASFGFSDKVLNGENLI